MPTPRAQLARINKQIELLIKLRRFHLEELEKIQSELKELESISKTLQIQLFEENQLIQKLPPLGKGMETKVIVTEKSIQSAIMSLTKESRAKLIKDLTKVQEVKS